MAKRILLIDSDEAFAQGLSSAISARGFATTTATNSEQGMTLAKSESPDLIVVCVEAQPTNGYMLCTRLKKDEQLKGIPVILTSANATADSFEKHKKLKTRAEEYLIKPFAPSVMLEKAATLMGVELPGADDEVALATDDEPINLGGLDDDEPISLSAEDARAARSPSAEPVEVEEVEEVVSIDESQEGGDDDLAMFDQAFDSLGSNPPPASGGSDFAQLRLASEAAPSGDDQVEVLEEEQAQPTEISAPDDDAVLHGLMSDGAADEAVEGEAGLEALQQSAAPAKRKAGNKAGAAGLREKLEAEIQQLKDDAGKREAAQKTLQQRADALAAATKKLERELKEAREELKSASGEKELLSEERDALKKMLHEAQAAAQQNEERAVKAYQQLKEGEKLRDKAKQALLIALRLLDENASADDVERALERAS